MAAIVRRVIGLGFDGKPIYAPKHAHSLLLAAAGGGKTTCGAVPWLQSMVADNARAIVIADSKEGEIAAQCAPMCLKHGRKVALVDDFGVLGFKNLNRISLNRLGAVISSYVKENGELIFSTEHACQALIEEPPRDQRNAYWRDEPRTLLEFAMCALLARSPRLATPGGVWSVLSDPKLLLDMARVEAEEGDETLRALALHVLGMRHMRYAAWAIVPVLMLGTYQLYGLPHLIWSYDWRPTGPSSYADFGARYYTRCSFLGPYGLITEYPTDGRCGWVRFAKSAEAQR